MNGFAETYTLQETSFEKAKEKAKEIFMVKQSCSPGIKYDCMMYNHDARQYIEITLEPVAA